MLWIRVLKSGKLQRELSLPYVGGDNPEESLREACAKLDIPCPMWLPTHEKTWQEFSRTTFIPDHFLEHVRFSKLEVEIYDADAPISRSRDPRNAQY